MSKAILITGATGKQGGAVLNALLASPSASDFVLVCLTRDASSPSGQKLAAKGSNVRVVEGNLDNPDAVFKKAVDMVGPIWGVFSVQLAMGGGATPVSEERQGKALVDAAVANNVKHFVYSSVDRGGNERSWNNPTDVPHFLSKHNIELHLREKAPTAGMTWTILRPVAFMDGLAPGMEGKVFATAWKAILKEKPLQLIATSDIGAVATLAFSQPAEFQGRAISLAGDDLSFAQTTEVFRAKTGKDLPTTFAFVGHALAWGVKELGKMLYWFRDEGYGADIAELKRMHPGLKDFGTWLETESKWEMKK